MHVLSLLFFLIAPLLGELPISFSINPKIGSHETLFFLETPPTVAFGKVKKRGEDTYIYVNIQNDDILSTAKAHFSYSEDIMEVYDNNDKLVGKIKRENSLIYPPKYSLFDSELQLIAHGWMNVVGSRFILTDPHHNQIAVIFHRPFFLMMGDQWYINIENPHKLPPLLILMTGILQTDLDTKHSLL